MKPWLFDILACPIDKHYPLNLYVFSYENPANLEKILKEFHQRNLEYIKKSNIIKISEEKGKIFIKDNIILEKKAIQEYLQLINASIDELCHFRDKSEIRAANQCLNLILSEVKDKISQMAQKSNLTSVDDILPELLLLNKYKLEVEIESGLIFCEQCNRWFPIIETIPQMLPDEYRDKKKELLFLSTKKNLLEEEFLKQDLKPFKP